MVYVDEIREVIPRGAAARYGSRWCHMTTDGSLEDLHLMADKIGLARRHFQNHPLHPHYDLTPPRRAKALANGAMFMPAREQAQKRSETREASAKGDDQ